MNTKVARFIAIFALLAHTALLPTPGKASVTLTFVEQPTGVVATTGDFDSLDVTDLSLVSTILSNQFLPPGIQSGAGYLMLGSSVLVSFYASGDLSHSSGLSGPSSFGTGGLATPTSRTGTGLFGIYVDPITQSLNLLVSQNPSLIHETDTWAGATFASLGLTPGTYTWTWGEQTDAQIYTNGGNVHEDSLTLQIGPVLPITTPVPEPSTWAMMILGFAGVGFMAYRRSRKDQGLALAAA